MLKFFKTFLFLLLTFIGLYQYCEAKCIPVRVFTGAALSYDESQVAYGVIEGRCNDKKLEQNWQLWVMNLGSKPVLALEYSTSLEPVGWMGNSVLLKDYGESLNYYVKKVGTTEPLTGVPSLTKKAVVIRANSVWFLDREENKYGLWRLDIDLLKRTFLNETNDAGELKDIWVDSNEKNKFFVVKNGKCEKSFLFSSKENKTMRLTESCSGTFMRGQWSPDDKIIAITVTDKDRAKLVIFDSLGKQTKTVSSEWEPVILSPLFIGDDPPAAGAVMPRSLYQLGAAGGEDIHAIFAFPGNVSFVRLGEKNKYILLGMDYIDQAGIKGFSRIGLYNIKDSTLQDLP